VANPLLLFLECEPDFWVMISLQQHWYGGKGVPVANMKTNIRPKEIEPAEKKTVIFFPSIITKIIQKKIKQPLSNFWSTF